VNESDLMIHEVVGDQTTWEHDWWIMRCGLIVRAHTDGSTAPNIDFVGPSGGVDSRITCLACKKDPGKLFAIDIEEGLVEAT
tara:strand:+ start:696 stop:941 length:246 start_codon:yes stop_codon:yes gene_type:complete